MHKFKFSFLKEHFNLRTMPNLEILNFPTNLYTTEQLAWLVAKLPNVQGYALRPTIKYDDNSGKDVLICGKRKPLLSSEEDGLNYDRWILTKKKSLTSIYFNTFCGHLIT
jgi:hypothetical protein